MRYLVVLTDSDGPFEEFASERRMISRARSLKLHVVVGVCCFFFLTFSYCGIDWIALGGIFFFLVENRVVTPGEYLIF